MLQLMHLKVSISFSEIEQTIKPGSMSGRQSRRAVQDLTSTPVSSQGRTISNGRVIIFFHSVTSYDAPALIYTDGTWMLSALFPLYSTLATIFCLNKLFTQIASVYMGHIRLCSKRTKNNPKIIFSLLFNTCS